MLSRHAEILFWIGRYLQRAAQTGQLVSATSMSQVERHVSADPWHEMLEVLYVDKLFHEHHDEVGPDEVLAFLVLDRANPGSIASSISAARDGLRNVRDLVPLDLLDAVNRSHMSIGSMTADELISQPAIFFDRLGVTSQRIGGVIHDSMVRSDGHRFLVIGQFLERAEMTLRSIDVNRRAAGDDVQTWVRVLRSVSGLHAFLHSRSALGTADDIVSFLLAGSDAPCCVDFALDRCDEELRIAFSGTQHVRSVRALGRLRSTIAYEDVPSVNDPMLGEFIERAELAIRQVSDRLRDDLFPTTNADLHPYEVV